MFYNNTNKNLTKDFFKNPSAEYKAMPFWAWDFKLNKEELEYQINVLEKMGFGGAVMHPRAGLETKYLSDEFMKYVGLCVKNLKEKNMFAIIYDEDRWPSGYAGGMVSKKEYYRQRAIRITRQKTECEEKNIAIKKGGTYFVACYDIKFNNEREIERYKKIDVDETAADEKWYVYSFATPKADRFNGESYIDTFSKEAVEYFIEQTYRKYLSEAGKEFGKSIKAVFTDEPQFARKHTIDGKFETQMPWSGDFEKTYFEKYKEDITASLPEIFWNLSDNRISKSRYFYHNHTADRITNAFLKTYRDFCNASGIYLTGHMVEETSMFSQTSSAGDVMRTYPYFDIPGIDMLCNNKEYVTAKQVQSVARQYGKEGIMSELYGVMGWNMDFKTHKLQGDWQAAMGVTLRVHSVALGSLKGIAKRDYPASVNYQSPWYTEYSQLEDHYTRLASVLTRGKAVVKTAVIHPIESYWLNFGPDSAKSIRDDMDKRLEELTDWLVHNFIDFDFINEELLSNAKVNTDDGFSVNGSKYDTIIIPQCETLRGSTVKYITNFLNSGGKVVIMGNCPKYINAESADLSELCDKSVKIKYSKEELLNVLERDIEIIGGENSLICTLRQEEDCLWLFIAHDGNESKTLNTEIKIKGKYIAECYDTMNGEIYCADYTTADGQTVIRHEFGGADSLLLKLTPCSIDLENRNENKSHYVKIKEFDGNMEYTVNDNVLLLDLAEFSEDGKRFNPKEEILRISEILREKYDYPYVEVYGIQPWAVENDTETKEIVLRFEFESELNINAEFACEEVTGLNLNGCNVPLIQTGFYVDHAIKKYKLEGIKQGKNILLVKVPFSKKTRPETCYIVGKFGVSADGRKIIKLCDSICFGDITSQGLPFYGDNVAYKDKFELKENSDIRIQTEKFSGALIKIYIDGADMGNVAYPPYVLDVKGLGKGVHSIEWVLFGNRYQTFAPLHNKGDCSWQGPNLWYPDDADRTQDYVFKEFGILKSPKLYIRAEKQHHIGRRNGGLT